MLIIVLVFGININYIEKFEGGTGQPFEDLQNIASIYNKDNM